MTETRPIWQQIAMLGAGQYAAVAQDGGMVALHTPMDEALGRLNAALADTALAWGDKKERDELEQKLARARRAPASVASSRLSYMAKAPEPTINSGRRDLIGALEAGEVELGTLSAEDLPSELRDLKPEAQQAIVAKKKALRDQLQKQVAELVEKRDAWIKTNRKGSGGDAFDRQVLEMLREQAKDVGLRYEAD
jgi:hypothetical protein